MKNRYLRYTLLIIVLILLIRLSLGYGKTSFEAYCPFGGMESLWGLFRQGEFTCALSPINLTMLIAILALTLLAKKAFCGWVCPIGFMGELLGKFGGKFFRKPRRVGKKLNAGLKLLRYVALALSLYFTYRIGDLILRGYDPFYAIFSGFGHGTLGTVSYIILGLIVVGGILIPMFFCRYLCPLGAVFDPFSRLGLIKVVRDEALCTACGSCRTACPHDLPVNETVKMRLRDCTNCLECVDACPEEEVLKLKLMV